MMMAVDDDDNDNDGDDDDQKKIESKSFFDFLSRVEQLWVSNFCLRSGGKVELSLGPTGAGVDFDMKKFSGQISF